MGVLEVENVTQILGGRKVLDNLSLDIRDGHIHAIVGPNGAGKSTLANTIMGLEGYRDFKGDIRFEGKSIRELPVYERARQGITLAWQEPARYEGLSVRRFVTAGAKNAAPQLVEDTLRTVGLDPKTYMDRAVDRTLSGGERKRIELASILAIGPRLVLMDEPDSGIDVDALEHIFGALKQLRENGAAVIMITHSLAVLKQADHAFLLCSGKLLDKGSAEKISRYFENRCLDCDHINEPDEGEFE
jgi:Fe-S cluster assembly ATP-binding protein